MKQPIFFGLNTLELKTAKNPGRLFNVVLCCQNLQGDADLVLAVTLCSRVFSVTLGRSSFFDHGRHQWAEFNLRLFRPPPRR